jgi:flagellar biogenesis protein FliO
MAWALMQTIGSLVAVLALMIGVLFVLKKWMYGSQVRSISDVDIQVVGFKHLQPKRSVYVLDIEAKRLVVGVSEAGIQILTELNKNERVSNLEGSMEFGTSARSLSFVDYLKENLGVVKPRSARVQKPKNTGI